MAAGPGLGTESGRCTRAYGAELASAKPPPTHPPRGWGNKTNMSNMSGCCSLLIEDVCCSLRTVIMAFLFRPVPEHPTDGTLLPQRRRRAFSPLNAFCALFVSPRPMFHSLLFTFRELPCRSDPACADCNSPLLPCVLHFCVGFMRSLFRLLVDFFPLTWASSSPCSYFFPAYLKSQLSAFLVCSGYLKATTVVVSLWGIFSL